MQQLYFTTPHIPLPSNIIQTVMLFYKVLGLCKASKEVLFQQRFRDLLAYKTQIKFWLNSEPLAAYFYRDHIIGIFLSRVG